MNLFTRAQQNLPLTPAERSFLKVLQGLVITFVIAATPIVWTAVTNWINGTNLQMNWGMVADNAFKAGLAAVGFVAWKYVSAFRDTLQGKAPAVGGAGDVAQVAQLAQGASQLATQLGLPAPLVGELASAVAKELSDKLNLGTGVAQIPLFQPFNIPDGTVIVKTPSGVSLPVPADAIPPDFGAGAGAIIDEHGTNGPVTSNAADTLSASSAPVASSGDAAEAGAPASA